MLLLYGVGLLVASLVSEWSNRTILSSAVVFLVLGFAAGPAWLGLVDVDLESPLIGAVTDVALIAILFSDGLKVGLGDLRSAWRLPGRALLIGMPLTALGIALAARLLFEMPWPSALLVGAILSPTDPVFASAIIGRHEVPGRIRHLLNVESGLNDGLALPFVLALIAFHRHTSPDVWSLASEAIGGALCGVAIAGAAGWIRRLRVFSVSASHEALLPLAVAVLIMGSAEAAGWNAYLAAYAGGLTLATVSPRSRDEFHDVGERLGEVLKLAALLLIAVTLSGLPTGAPTIDYLFAAIVLTFARTAAMVLALLGSGLPWRERMVAAWFGPKGFASVVYGLMLLRSGIPDADQLFKLVAVTIVLSIVVHSSTDVPIAHYFRRRGLQPGNG